MFHQIEGLVADKDIALHLKVYHYLLKPLEAHLDVRPMSYFPLQNHPLKSMSNASCVKAQDVVCSHTGWLEVMGCGMVHPTVFGQTASIPLLHRLCIWYGY